MDILTWIILVALAVPSIVVVGLISMIVHGYWKSRKP